MALDLLHRDILPIMDSIGTAVDALTLEAALASQRMRHALNEAAWAGRLLLSADASLILLGSGDSLAAVAWQGREADGVQLNGAASNAVQFLRAGRRSVAWDTLDHCVDAALTDILHSLELEAGILVPVRVHGNLLGIWLVAADARRSFGSQDELTLHTLAENIGLITESILLSEENLRYRREADALYQIGTEISELRDLDAVLTIIAEQARALLHAEISYIALAYDDAREIRVRVTSGTRSSLLRTMVLKYGEGIGGVVASSRMPLITDDYPADPRPKPPGVAEIAATEDIHSIISVPMYTRTRLTGVLFVASRRPAAFSQAQIGLLSALGVHAAIAIENARLYEQERVNAEALRTLNAALEHERAMLQANATVHQQLLDLVLGNRGMQAIADTLAGLVRGPIVIEDQRLHVLCCSREGGVPSEQGGGGLADIWQDAALRGQVSALRDARRITRIPARPDRRMAQARTVAPIVAGASLLGYISALEVAGPLGETERSAVEQASIVLALEFLKQEAALAVEQRLARDFLEDLLFGPRDADPWVFQRAARLRVDLVKPHRVLVFDIDDFAGAIKAHKWSDLEALAAKRALLDAVNDALHGCTSGAIAGRRGDSVLALAPAPAGSSALEAADLARRVQAAALQTLPDLTISAGIGRVAYQPAELNHSYLDAAVALRTVRSSRGRGRVVAFEDLGVIPLLLQSEDQTGLTAFMERNLRPLLDYDARHATQLLATLEQFLAHNGNLQRSAEACFVHLNSLKYRMRRIAEIAGLDLDDADTRFNLRLALTIRSALALVRAEQT